MIDDGERQVAPTLDGIRKDHVERYRWALAQLEEGKRALDCACGVGYGASLLARGGLRVEAFDRSPEAIAYARQHYWLGGATFVESDVGNLELLPGSYDAAVAFEIIEHLEDPLPFLKALRQSCGLLLASVPNENVFPFHKIKFHHRHYTRDEFEALLNEAGWQVEEWWGQKDHLSVVERDVEGRTLVAKCRPGEAVIRLPRLKSKEGQMPKEEIPARVAILGLGPSLNQYLDLVKVAGSRRVHFDEVWTINALGDSIACDRVFHMDDVRIQEIRAAAAPKSNIAYMLGWLRKHPGPIFTSRTHPDYPGLVEFPLEKVVNKLGHVYFNSTCAYAVAYAIFLGVKRIALFGLDFTYPDRHGAEKGRACVEFWLGQAAARGININIASNSSLYDSCEGQQARLYGYDTLDVKVLQQEDHTARIEFHPKEKLPTAEEMELRYDHGTASMAEVPVSEATVA